MKSLCFVVVMCLYGLSAPLTAQADKLCSDSAKDWLCFGQIEVRLAPTKDQKTGTCTAKWLFFNNNEETIQIEKDDIKFEQLAIPKRVLLYRGLSKTQNQKKEAEEIVSGASLLISLPIEVLKTAYPSGPQSIGDDTNTIPLQNPQETLTTTRKSPHQIEFTIKKGPVTISGSWDSQLAEPYPDDLDLRAWSHSGTATINILSDARFSVPRLRSK